MRHPPRPPGSRAGFTVAEMLAVLVIMGIMAAIAVPRLDIAEVRTAGAVQVAGSTLLAAQRAAVTRQHDVVVAFDPTGRAIRLHYDRDNDGRADAGEEVRAEPLAEGVVFGRGAAPAYFVGPDAVTFTRRAPDGLRVVTFHRSGSASEEGGVYLTTRRGRAADARVVVVDRATGRASWLAYTGSTWKREF